MPAEAKPSSQPVVSCKEAMIDASHYHAQNRGYAPLRGLIVVIPPQIMSNRYPKLSKSAKLGEQGVRNVERVVNEELGWLFRRIHQEHDFGIDGHIDIVLPDGSVTGMQMAAQIKHGSSFFSSKTQDGYVYRGDSKHFNFLCNYPCPVLIVLSHPKDGVCYWQIFHPDLCTHYANSWTLVIPFANNLSESQAHLLALLPEIRDHLADHQEAGQKAELLRESGYIAIHVPRSEVESMSVQTARSFFNSLKRSKELALAAQGKVVIYFSGFDSDSRELYEIDSMRKYIPLLDYALPELFFFARTDEPRDTLPTFALCQIPIVDKTMVSGTYRLEMDGEYLAAFLTRHWPGLNQMTEWLGLSKEENERIGRAAVSSLASMPDEV